MNSTDFQSLQLKEAEELFKTAKNFSRKENSDTEHAVSLFKAVAQMVSKEHPLYNESYYQIALVYRRNKNYKFMHEALLYAVKGKHPSSNAYTLLGDLFSGKIKSEFDFNAELANNYYDAGFKLGNLVCAKRLCVFYHTHEPKYFSEEYVFSAIEAALRLDEPICMYYYGRHLLMGIGTQKNASEGAGYIALAAERADKEKEQNIINAANLTLARDYFMPIGNFAAARYHLEKLGKNSKEATSRINEIDKKYLPEAVLKLVSETPKGEFPDFLQIEEKFGTVNNKEIYKIARAKETSGASADEYIKIYALAALFGSQKAMSALSHMANPKSNYFYDKQNYTRRRNGNA